MAYYDYGSGYGSSYKGKKKYGHYDDDDYSYGRYYGGGFNWGRFGYSSFDYTEEDSDDIIISAHDNYITPKRGEISKELDYKSDTHNNVNIIKEYSRFFYHKMLDNKKYFKDKYYDEGKLSKLEKATLDNKKAFYNELWEKFIPGYTPLEQALNLFSQINQVKEENKHNKNSREKMSDQEALKDIDFNQEMYFDADMNDLFEANPNWKKRKFSILNKLSLIKNFGAKFKVKKDVDEKEVPNSVIRRKKMMREMHQLPNMDMYQFLLPNFKSKLLTNSIIVNTPIDISEHKQKIIIILDFSGSMSDSRKQEWVVAIMLDRLRYAMKEEAEIFFSYFIYSIEELHFTHIYDRTTAIDFWKKFSTNPNGGTTRIGTMVNHIGSQIEKGRLCNLEVDLKEERPEILIINDGQDTVDTKDFKYKANAITLIDGLNTGLKDLCLANKGKYIRITVEEGKDKLQEFE
jgi:hypothetical protein